MPTTVINKKSGDPFDIYIGRGSIWGNPFKMNNQSASERTRVIQAYEEHLLSSPHLLRQIRTLANKRLACFCAPKPCHGDILAYYANTLIGTGRLPDKKATEDSDPAQPPLPFL